MKTAAFAYPKANYICDTGCRVELPGKILISTENLAPIPFAVSQVLSEIQEKSNSGSQEHSYEIKLSLCSNEKMREKIYETNRDLPQIPLEEAYIIYITETHSSIYALNEQGLFYGVQTLKQTFCFEEGRAYINKGTVIDWPHKEFRAVHFYMPGKNQLDYFKRLIKIASSLKYNKLVLEVGAGMELERHPEINEAWERFSREVSAFPGGEHDMQTSQGYIKDSMHPQLGGGSFISREQVREIIEYANSHYIEVIPEVQSLGHCYYMLTAHKELAERYWDPWPDTYCPSNPKTYEVLFDIMDEVIEVFKPRAIHIGHDEVHTLKICPLCKDKDAAKLFSDDVNKIYDYLKERGISTCMWSDMLTAVETHWGFTGGGPSELYDPVHQEKYYFHDTTASIDMLPKDILLFNWMWWVSHDVQVKLAEKGYNMVVGNFPGPDFKNWEKWGSYDYIKGAIIAAWCDNDFHEQSHDGILFNLVYSSYCLWNTGFNEDRKNDVRIHAAQVMPEIYNFLAGCEIIATDSVSSAFVPVRAGGADKSSTETLPDIKESFVFTRCGVNPDNLDRSRFIRLNCQNPSHSLKLGQKVSSFRVTHFWNGKHLFVPSWGRLDIQEKETVGSYTLVYADSFKVTVPVKYGINISNIQDEWGTVTGINPPFGPETACYMAEPIFFNRDGKMTQAYCFTFKNPFPEKKVEKIEIAFESEDTGEFVVSLVEISE